MVKVINEIFSNDFAEGGGVGFVCSEEGDGRSEGANRLPLCMQMTVSWTHGWLPHQWPQPQPLLCPSHYLKWDEEQAFYMGP